MPTSDGGRGNRLVGTKTCRYFLDRYRVATIDAAVECAARHMHPLTLPGFEDICEIPIKVREIAERREVKVREDLSPSTRKEAYLVAGPDRFVVRLRQNLPESRKRLSIAHELGHTLFYKDFNHRIASLDGREIAAEEEICWRFARALLMPGFALKQLLTLISSESPWQVIDALEKAGDRLEVSLPALLARLGSVRPSLGHYLFVCSRFVENRRTQSDPQLRVESSYGLGQLQNCYIWNNRTMGGLNLSGALQLFDAWRTGSTISSRLTPGPHMWADGSGLLNKEKEFGTLMWQSETVEVSVFNQGRWQNCKLPFRTSHYLQAWGRNEREAYVLSVLTPLAMAEANAA